MIPQERGFEGLSAYFLFQLPFLSKECDRLHELLGEGYEVLDSPCEILEPIPGLIVGLFVGQWSLIIGSSTPSLLHFIYLFPSRPSMHSLTHPLIHPHLRLGLVKGKELLRINHRLVGCSGRWCNPAMTWGFHV
jgi:hypothetical protein